MLGDVSERPDVTSDLVDRWRALAADLGFDATAPGHEGSEAVRDDLLARYAERHRHHHDQRHLHEVLVALDDLADGAPVGPSVRLAAWFHDAVYDGVAGDDEAASADLARRELAGLGLDGALVERVATMVEATAGHLTPGEATEVDDDTALLLDADLSILAADAPRYDLYAAGIRAEHPDVDEARFRAGRAAALRTLSSRDALFHTEAGRRRLEPAARANLARELGRLSAPADDG